MIEKRSSIEYLLKKFNELDNLKKVLLDEIQNKTLDCIKEKLPSNSNSTLGILEESECKNMLDELIRRTSNKSAVNSIDDKLKQIINEIYFE